MKNLNSIALRVALAILFSALLTMLFLKKETPYIAEVISKRPFSYDKATYFLDLNSDGKSERILLSKPTPGTTGLVVYDDNEHIIDQFNLAGSFVRRSEVFSGDYDNNGSAELYTFTYQGDSLFLNLVDVYNRTEPLIARKYIGGCKTIDGVAEYMIVGSFNEDVNGDGSKEFFFAISAGFTLSPRALYYYDVKNNQVKNSPLAGIGPRYFLYSYDLDKDGSSEFWGESNASGNFKTPMPYSDKSAWLMIYSHKLDFEFEPIEFKGFSSLVKTRVLEGEDNNRLVVFRNIGAKSDTSGDEICIFSSSGELLLHRDLKDYNITNYAEIFISGNKIILISNDGKVLIFDENLKLLKMFEKEWLEGFMYGPSSISGDNSKQLLVLSKNGTMHILSTNLKRLATIELGDMSGYRKDPVFVSNSNARTGFHLRTANFDYQLSFSVNKGRNYVYLYSFLIFAALYVFITFIQVLQLKLERKRQEAENKLRTLQLQALKSQMSPHFIFNALNSISAMYIKGDTSRADAFLTNFSKMIREVVDSSDRLIVELHEEIEFVRNYLELEQVRHEDRLSFSINIPENCRFVKIPSMSIHTFAENSLKHGFRGKKKLHVQIDASCTKDLLTIIISDDGIGYNKTRTGEGRQGKGLKMIEEIFSTYLSISGRKIGYSITDLSETEPYSICGSEVKITLEL